MSIKKVGALVVVITLFFILAGCLSRPVINIDNHPVPTTFNGGQLSLNQVASAINQAGTKLGWVMTQKKPGLINAFINLRGHSAEVAITYNQTNYSINYSDSYNMDYNGTTINHKYNDWIERLGRVIDIDLMKVANPDNTIQ